MYKFININKLDLGRLHVVARILNACGKDMATKNNLHHWDNFYLKSLAIVGMCALKNDVYLLYREGVAVATFMVRKEEESLHFEKLATLPAESGKGIGTLCMEKIEEIASLRDCNKVCMEVYEPSHHAISFYEHKGYEAVGMTDTLKYKEVKMEKSI